MCGGQGKFETLMIPKIRSQNCDKNKNRGTTILSINGTGEIIN